MNYIGSKVGNHYSNTYNPKWKDYPNLRRGGNQGGSSVFEMWSKIGLDREQNAVNMDGGKIGVV